LIKNRGEVLDATDQVDLTIQFKDQNGDPINTDSFPKISIINPSGLVLLAPTSVGVTQIGVGRYSYIFTIPINGPYGIYRDDWVGYVNGFRIETMFEFAVLHTQVPAINTDGYVHLGDDPGFNYSQTATININKLIKVLKARLDSDFVDQFLEILVEGATLYALTSKALIERGREFSITDNGINFVPPTVSELMMTQSNTLLTHYWDKLKMIKASLRPNPKGIGLFSMSSGFNPAVRRLRHLRERRII